MFSCMRSLHTDGVSLMLTLTPPILHCTSTHTRHHHLLVIISAPCSFWSCCGCGSCGCDCDDSQDNANVRWWFPITLMQYSYMIPVATNMWWWWVLVIHIETLTKFALPKVVAKAYHNERDDSSSHLSPHGIAWCCWVPLPQTHCPYSQLWRVSQLLPHLAPPQSLCWFTLWHTLLFHKNE